MCTHMHVTADGVPVVRSFLMHRLPTIYVHYAAEEHCDSACSILISSSKGGPYTWPSSESSMAVLQIGCTMIGSLPDSFSSRPSCAYSCIACC